MDQNEIPHVPRHLGVTSGASKMISKPVIRLPQTMQLSCVRSNTISKQSVRFQLSLITYEYHRVRPKWFLSLWYVCHKLYTYHASTLILFPNGLKQDSTWPHQLGVLSGVSKMISEPMVCLTQSVHLSCIKGNTISKRTEMRFHITTSPSSCIMCGQNDFVELVVRLAQTVHLSCTDTNTIFKQTETTFHMTQVT
jgi:hypothetical protein